MYIFLITFFLIYGSAHYFFFQKAMQAIQPNLTANLALSSFLIAMVISPLGTRLLEKSGHEASARSMAYAGYCWMGFLFLFISASACTTLYRIIINSANELTGKNFLYPLPANRVVFFGCCFFALATSVYGWFEAQNIHTQKIVIKTSKIPFSASPLRIVQISDVHFGLIIRGDRADRIINSIREADPHLIVSTGDLVDGHVSHFAGISNKLKSLRPPMGMYAVTGNHEYIAGINQALEFTKESGFKILQGTSIKVTNFLTISGEDDPISKRFGNQMVSEKKKVSSLSGENYNILLKHRPVISPEAIDRIDLQLSGHVHKGQIVPFNLLTWLIFPVKAGMNRITEKTSLYVSRGTGTWGPPIRVLSPPEITVFEFLAEK